MSFDRWIDQLLVFPSLPSLLSPACHPKLWPCDHLQFTSTKYPCQGPTDFWEAKRVDHWVYERVAVVQKFTGVNKIKREFIPAGFAQIVDNVYNMEREPGDEEDARHNSESGD